MPSRRVVPFGRPRWKEIRAPIQLGRQAAIGRLAWACYTQADGIVVGRVLGDSTLGVYRMGMNLASAPAGERQGVGPEVVLELGLAEALLNVPTAVEHISEAHGHLDDPVRRAQAAEVLAEL